MSYEERSCSNHDLRTSLTVLKGYDELLQAGEDSQVRSVAVTMGKHIARMERYVDSMSQLQRLEDRQPEYQRISLSELLTQIEENANIICRENDKKICLRNQAVSGHFRLDGMFLSQVCGNLVANAARHADTQVTLILEERDGGLALTVADDGPGFDGKMLREAWNPYVTGEERREEHFGLGLYICRLLSERHGGWLKVENGASGAKVTAFFKNGPLGANGAGKTTLMRLLCALQRPTEGRILLDGKNIEKLGEGYRGLLGYLPQGFGYYPDFRAIDFLRYIAALKGLEGKAGERRSWELLEEVGLSCEARHRIKTFSGGMKQRLGIAQAMLNDPRILILDEPTTGLDPKERVRFRNLISAFSKGRIVILSTHIVSDVEFIAERILVMKSGQIVHCGRPGEITSEIQGQVWECAVPAGHADRYVAELNVSNLRNERDGRTVLRVIAGERPMGNARLVELGGWFFCGRSVQNLKKYRRSIYCHLPK